MSATRWPAQPPSVPGLPPRPVVMWAPYRYGVFSWLQSQDQQIAETIDFLRSEILRGVTDGSAAAAGQIGEYLISDAHASVPGDGATVVAVTSLSLAAGDWSVSGEIGFNGAGATDFYTDFAANANDPVPNRGATLWGVGGGGFLTNGSTVPTASEVRVLSASVSPVFLRARITTTDGQPADVWGAVWARRVR